MYNRFDFNSMGVFCVAPVSVFEQTFPCFNRNLTPAKGPS